jgi:hypothetical protein
MIYETQLRILDTREILKHLFFPLMDEYEITSTNPFEEDTQGEY